MANQFDPRVTGGNAASVGVPRAARDVGLRSYMLSVYNYMASGVLLTAIVALMFAPYAAQVLISQSGRGLSGLGWIVTLAPLGFVIALSRGSNSMKLSTMKAVFFAFAAVMGLSLSTIFIAYTGVSIGQTFAAVTASFLGLSLFGYTTKKDLSGMGTFLIMGVVGLLVASVANMFIHSSAMQLAISAIGVLLFAGLTAYDTQAIKSMYANVQNSDMAGRTAIMGALKLYLDFINMFQFLLMFMGNRR